MATVLSGGRLACHGSGGCAYGSANSKIDASCLEAPLLVAFGGQSQYLVAGPPQASGDVSVHMCTDKWRAVACE